MESKTKMVKDISIRWNSAFDMLDSITKNYVALKNMCLMQNQSSIAIKTILLKKFLKENRDLSNKVAANLISDEEIMVTFKYFQQ